MTSNPHDIVPAHLAVQAMRDNGYKNAAYAIAELMDNAIQAEASQVELLCGERKQMGEQRKRSRIEEIAVLDNGCGMDARVLRMALQFGNGTYLDADKHTGIGRFGMGLPSSSISQCQRVDVWSWQNGICIWSTGKTIIEHSELLIGRMYRKFLDAGQVSIRMLAFDLDSIYNIIVEKYALPNDPGYLMKKTSCPEPFDNQAMFQAWEGDEHYEATFSVDFRGQKMM